MRNVHGHVHLSDHQLRHPRLLQVTNKTASDMLTNTAWCIKEVQKKYDIRPEDCCPSLLLLDQGACLCDDLLDSKPFSSSLSRVVSPSLHAQHCRFTQHTFVCDHLPHVLVACQQAERDGTRVRQSSYSTCTHTTTRCTFVVHVQRWTARHALTIPAVVVVTPGSADRLTGVSFGPLRVVQHDGQRPQRLQLCCCDSVTNSIPHC